MSTNQKQSKSKESSSSRAQAGRVKRLSTDYFGRDLEAKIIDLTGPIQTKATTIRHTFANWQPHLKRDLFNEKDYSFLNAFKNTQSKQDRDQLLNAYKTDAFKTLLKVVQYVPIVKDIQKVLVLIDDMLWEDVSRIDDFTEAETDPWKEFMNLFQCSDEFVRNLASRITTKLLVAHRCKAEDSEIIYFLTWLKHELRSDNEYLLCVARCLQKLLRIDKCRIFFLNLNGFFKIVRILHSEIRTQVQYQLIFCIWVSSYSFEVAERLHFYGTIQLLMELLESSPAEIVKLPRIIFATFRNLLEKPQKAVKKENAMIMIQYKLLKWLPIIKSRATNSEDPEFLEDFSAVEDLLNEYVAELSTFDEYALEIRSGYLEWSIVHTSKAFWSANAERLNENNYEILKALISLLEISKEKTVLCVAAHDLGEFMNHYPRGDTLVEEFGGKDALLKLLNHDHPEVKFYALKSLQILMLKHCDILADFAGAHGSKSR